MEKERASLPICTDAAQIASTALTHGLPLVTRNVKDFGNITGLTIINPWSEV